MTKRKNKIFIALLCVIMVIGSAASALADGGSDAGIGKPAEADGNPANEFKTSGGKLSWAKKNNDTGKYECLKVPAKYANTVTQNITTTPKSTSVVIEGQTRKDLEIWFHNGGDHENGKEILGGEKDEKWTFNLDKQTRGTTAILYKNYTYTNFTTGEKTLIDVKATLNGWNYKKHKVQLNDNEGTADDNECECSGYGKDAKNAPYLAIGKNLTQGFPKTTTVNVGDLNIKYQFYKAGTDTPIKISSSITYYDIDDNQALSYHADNVKYIAATPNTKLNYAKDGDWHVFVDPSEKKVNAQGLKNPEYCAAAAFEGYGIGIKYTAAQHDPKGNKSWGNPHGARAAFEPAPYKNQIIQFEMPEPAKVVYDGDGVTKKGEGDETLDAYDDGKYDGKENTVATPKRTWKYNIYQYIPKNFHPDTYKLSSFVIHDQFDGNNFEIVNGKDGVTVACGGVDKTGSFDINVTEAGKLTVTAKSALFNNEDFYKTVKVNFTMRVKDGKSLSDLIAAGYELDNDGFIQMKNEAWSVVKDAGNTDVTTRDSNNNPVKSTTKTNIGSKKPKKNPLWKFVSDKDNVTLTGNGSEDYDWHMADNKEENTIEKMGSDFTYHLINTIPPDYSPIWYYDSYEMTDTVPALVKIDRSKVRVYSVTYTKNENNTYTYSDLTDITNQFDATFTNDDRTITVAAKEALLNSASFYDNKRILLQFGCNIDTANYNTMSKLMPWFDKSAGKAMLTWENKGKLTVRDKETSIYEGADAIYNAPVYTAESKVVKTHVKIPKPKKNAPTKEVSDSDNRTLTGTCAERNVTENTLDKVGETYTYHIKHKVKDDDVEYLPLWYFKSYKITDKVADLLLIQDGAKVYEGSTDVTSKFDIAVSADKHTITATAKTAEIAKAEFYGKTYELRFDVKIDRDKYKTESQLRPWIDSKYGGRILTWLNNATVDITDEVDPSDPNSENGKGTWSKRTNDTTTHIQLPKPKKNLPVKQVTDSDNKTLTGTGAEVRVNENTLEIADETYTYHVRHRLGSGVNDVWDEGAYASYWFFKSYKMTDRVEDLLLIQDGAKVYEYTWDKNNTNSTSGEKDVTSKFDIVVSQDKKTITATAKAGSLTAEDFYNVKMYELRFNAKIDTEKYKYESDLAKWATDNDKGSKNIRIRWPNKATVDITDNVDPYDPNSENGKGTWKKDTNTVHTNVWIPTPDGDIPEDPNDPRDPDDPKKPGLSIVKTTKPYEFRVGETIPYTITITQKNKDAVAYLVEAEDTDLPEGFTIDKESVKAVGGTEPNAWVEGDNTLKITAKYLRYGEKLVVTFNGTASKDLNGKVVPNEVIGRAWGTHEADKSTWDRDHTSVYINSPKADITKTVKKRANEDGSVTYQTGDNVQFTSVITNKNPGTFMRNIYAVDTSETEGLILNPSTIKVKYNSKTDSDRLVTLKEGRDYEIETYDAGETIPMDNLGMKVGSRDVEDYEVKTATPEENEKAESEKGTGAVLPTKNEGGFIIKFLGKYRNLGYTDKTIPATEDERGKVVRYLTDELKAIEEENGVDYTTDYANLNLQNKLVITYNMTVENEDLAGQTLENFIRVPATENTNNDLINDDDSIPSGGDYARTDIGVPDPILNHEKEVKEESTYKDGVLHYTLTSRNSSEEKAYDVIITDGFTSGNAVMNKDVKVKLGGKDITESCTIEYLNAEKANEESANTDNTDQATDENVNEDTEGTDESSEAEEKPIGFKVQLNREFKPGEEIVITYTGTTISEDPDKVHNETVLTARGIDPIKDEEDVPIIEPPEIVPKLTKSVVEEYAKIGDKLHYTVKAENESEQAAQKVVFTDEIKSFNLNYDKDSVKVMLGEEDITKDCEIEVVEGNLDIEGETDVISGETDVKKDDIVLPKLVVKTNHDLEPGQIMLLTYEGTVTEWNISEEKVVHNVVEMTGDNFKPLDDEVKVPLYPSSKTTTAKITHKGSILQFTLELENNKDKDMNEIVFNDEITSKNAKFQNDFKVFVGENEITDFKVNSKDEYSVSIELDKDVVLKTGEKAKVTYSVKATNDEEVTNVNHDSTSDGKTPENTIVVPPAPDHVKSVKENQHDGPEGQINVLHFTINSKNKTGGTLKNVVITDEILTNNFDYNKDVKISLNGEDVTDKVKITYIKAGEKAEIGKEDFKNSVNARFIIETGMELKEGEEFVTIYSGKVKDKNVIHNITTLTADDMDGITDEQIVPGPEEGVYVTVHKTSEPPSGSVVKEKDEIKYILTAINTGKDIVPFTQIRDVIPKGTTFKEVYDNGVYSEKGNYAEWVVTDLKTGESKQVSFTVTVNDNPPKEIWNVATYKSYTENPGKPGEIPTAPDKRTEETVHYTDEEHDTHPLLRAVKSSEPVTESKVKVGDKIKYFIELENYGDADAKNAVIRDYIPEGTKFVSTENEGKYSEEKGYIDWYPLNVKAGEKVKVAFTVEVTEEALEQMVVENQALYQNDFEPEKGKDPSSETNIVEHPIIEPDKPAEDPKTPVEPDKPVEEPTKTDDTKTLEEPIKADEPTTPEEPVIVDEPETPKEELKPDTAIEHNKAVKESVTAKDKILHYELTTNILTDVEDVIITDEVTSKNLAYNKNSIKVYYNGDDITKNVEIQAKEHSFLIKTGIDAIQEDEFKVTYEGKVTNNKTVKNTSSAYGKDVDPVKSSVKVDSAKTELSHEKNKAESSAKTGDNTPMGIAAALLIISAVIAMILLFKRNRT